MGAPTVYSWDDPGAPAWTASVNSAYEVLLACLVNGYPGKAGAGWSVVYDDWVNSGNVSFTNAAQSGVLGLWHPKINNTTYSPVAYIAEAMITATQPFNGRSGPVGVADTQSLSFTNSNLQNLSITNQAGKQWVVVANESFAILLACPAGSAGLNMSAPSYATISGSGSAAAFLFGALNTSYGLGAGVESEVGNFVAVGGGYYYSPRGFLDWGSALYRPDLSANPLTDAYPFVSPFYGQPAGCSLAIFDSQLLPAFCSFSSQANVVSRLESSYQLGCVPGLFGFRDIARFSNQARLADNWLGGVTFKTVSNIAGRSCLHGYLTGAVPVAISLEAGDW